MFAKYLNDQGIFAVSLDIRNTRPEKGSNPVIADAEILPFPDESFDIITTRGMLDYMIYEGNDIEKVYKEVARVLKPGGIFYAEMLNLGDPHDELIPKRKIAERYFRILYANRYIEPVIMEKKSEIGQIMPSGLTADYVNQFIHIPSVFERHERFGHPLDLKPAKKYTEYYSPELYKDVVTEKNKDLLPVLDELVDRFNSLLTDPESNKDQIIRIVHEIDEIVRGDKWKEIKKGGHLYKDKG